MSAANDRIYVWGNNPRRAELKGRRCRIVCVGTRQSALFEFENGERVVSSIRAARKVNNLDWLSSDTWRDAQNMLNTFPGGEVYFDVQTPHGESIGLVLADVYTKRGAVQDQAQKLWLEEKGLPLPPDAKILYKEITG